MMERIFFISYEIGMNRVTVKGFETISVIGDSRNSLREAIDRIAYENGVSADKVMVISFNTI